MRIFSARLITGSFDFDAEPAIAVTFQLDGVVLLFVQSALPVTEQIDQRMRPVGQIDGRLHRLIGEIVQRNHFTITPAAAMGEDVRVAHV